MNDQTDRRTMNEPGTPVIPMINWTGLWTLYLKEVRRFFKVQLQTIWGPALTTLLFLVIFTVALGRAGRTVMGVPFADRSEEHTSELQSLMRISYAVFCLKKKKK